MYCTIYLINLLTRSVFLRDNSPCDRLVVNQLLSTPLPSSRLNTVCESYTSVYDTYRYIINIRRHYGNNSKTSRLGSGPPRSKTVQEHYLLISFLICRCYWNKLMGLKSWVVYYLNQRCTGFFITPSTVGMITAVTIDCNFSIVFLHCWCVDVMEFYCYANSTIINSLFILWYFNATR